MIAAAVSLLSSAAPAAELTPLLERQRVVAVLVASGVLVLVIELVRRRKLREEYSWVWVATSLVLIALAASSDLLHILSSWIGAASSVSTLFFGAFVFLLALVLQFSVRLSRLTHRHRTLAQRMALLEEEVRRLREIAGNDSPVELGNRRDRATGSGTGNDEVA